MTRAQPRKRSVRQPTARRRRYVLRLYVIGTTGRSVKAIQNVRRICDTYLEGAYDLEVVDVYKNLPLARHDHIFAAPTLLRRRPLPLRRMIGDMSDETRVLAGLNLDPRGDAG